MELGGEGPRPARRTFFECMMGDGEILSDKTFDCSRRTEILTRICPKRAGVGLIFVPSYSANPSLPREGMADDSWPYLLSGTWKCSTHAHDHAI